MVREYQNLYITYIHEVLIMSIYPLNEKVSRLIQYVNELSQLRQKPVLSFRRYENILWVHSKPEIKK